MGKMSLIFVNKREINILEKMSIIIFVKKNLLWKNYFVKKNKYNRIIEKGINNNKKNVLNGAGGGGPDDNENRKPNNNEINKPKNNKKTRNPKSIVFNYNEGNFEEIEETSNQLLRTKKYDDNLKLIGEIDEFCDYELEKEKEESKCIKAKK